MFSTIPKQLKGCRLSCWFLLLHECNMLWLHKNALLLSPDGTIKSIIFCIFIILQKYCHLQEEKEAIVKNKRSMQTEPKPTYLTSAAKKPKRSRSCALVSTVRRSVNARCRAGPRARVHRLFAPVPLQNILSGRTDRRSGDGTRLFPSAGSRAGACKDGA